MSANSSYAASSVRRRGLNPFFNLQLQTRRGMKTTAVFFVAMILGLANTVAGSAQEIREQDIAGMRKVDPKEMDPTYTKPAPYAQKLVEDALAKHPEVILIAIHAQPPGHKNLIVASNFGRIGKIGDEDDMRCIRTGKSNLEIGANGTHFEDELILLDSSGKTIGALGVVFHYNKGDDKAALEKIAIQTRDEMKAQLPTAKALFAK